jgi:hypothetical protein
MEIHKRSVLMLAGPAVSAFLLGALLTSGPLLSTTNQFGEALHPTGYVTVSVVRDGNEIYHYEDHNLITNAGKDYIADQLSDTPSATEIAKYIALSSDATAPAATDTSLTGEITAATGLQRAGGTFAHTAGTDNWTISNTFTAGASFTAVQKAGLFTDGTNGAPDTLVAENTFSSVNLANNDQLTITWTIDLGL